MKQRWALPWSAIALVLISHAALAADASAVPATPVAVAPVPATPAPATNAPEAGPPPTPSPQGNTKRRASNLSEAQRECASRMYGALPRGRSAPNWTIYDRCMRQRGAA